MLFAQKKKNVETKSREQLKKRHKDDEVHTQEAAAARGRRVT